MSELRRRIVTALFDAGLNVQSWANPTLAGLDNPIHLVRYSGRIIAPSGLSRPQCSVVILIAVSTAETAIDGDGLETAELAVINALNAADNDMYPELAQTVVDYEMELEALRNVGRQRINQRFAASEMIVWGAP